MAEGLLKKMLDKKGINGVDVSSCGTSALPSFKVPGVVLDLMKEEGVDLTKHKARYLTKEIAEASSLILVMENAHKEYINLKFPESSKKVYLLKEFDKKNGESLEISDPIGQAEEIYIKTKDEIKGGLEKLINILEDK